MTALFDVQRDNAAGPSMELVVQAHRGLQEHKLAMPDLAEVTP